MIVTRFCSEEEYCRYRKGEVLVNNTDHYDQRSMSPTAVGFCFTEDPPEVAIKYLWGIITPEICMVLDIPDNELDPSVGLYRKGKGEVESKQEWCLTRYSKKTAKLVKVKKIEELVTIAQLKAMRLVKAMFG